MSSFNFGLIFALTFGWYLIIESAVLVTRLFLIAGKHSYMWLCSLWTYVLECFC